MFLTAIASIGDGLFRWGNRLMTKCMLELTDAGPKQLENLVTKGKTAAHKIKHANILLEAEAPAPYPRITEGYRGLSGGRGAVIMEVLPASSSEQ
jgi:hypothetical protein